MAASKENPVQLDRRAIRVRKVRLGRKALPELPDLRGPLGLRVPQAPPDRRGLKATQVPRRTQNRKFLIEAASVSGLDV